MSGYIKYSSVNSLNHITITGSNNIITFPRNITKLNIENHMNSICYLRINSNPDFLQLILPYNKIHIEDFGFINNIEFITNPALVTIDGFN